MGRPPACACNCRAVLPSPGAGAEFGLHLGGRIAGTISSNSVSKFDFASEAWSAVSAVPLDDQSEVNNSPTLSEQKSYLAGGVEWTGTASETAQAQKYDFTSEAFSLLGSSLTNTRRWTGCVTDREATGFFIAGANAAVGVPRDTSDKVAFATDAVSAVASADAPSAVSQQGCANAESAGYLAGGASTPGGAATNRIDKVTFATEVNATIGATISVSRSSLRGSSNLSAAYVCGSSGSTVTDKLDFATESTSTPAGASLTEARGGHSGFGNGTYSYFAGGMNFSGGTTTRKNTERIEYATDTMLLLASGAFNGSFNHGHTGDTGL